MNKKLILLLFVVLSTVGCKTFGMTRTRDSFCKFIENGNFDAAQAVIKNLLRGQYKESGREWGKILNAILAHDQNRTLALSAQSDEALARAVRAENEYLVNENQQLKDRLATAEQHANEPLDTAQKRAEDEISRLTRRINNLETEQVRLNEENTDLKSQLASREGAARATKPSLSSQPATKKPLPPIPTKSRANASSRQQTAGNQESSEQAAVMSFEQAQQLLRTSEYDELQTLPEGSPQPDYDVIDVEENEDMILGSLISKIAARDHLQVLLNVDVEQMISEQHIQAIRDAVCFFINCYSQDCAYNKQLIGISRDAGINLRDIPYLNKCVRAAAVIIEVDPDLATININDQDRNPHELAQEFIDSHPNKHKCIVDQ